MNISIDDRVMEGLSRYSAKESVDLERMVSEALTQYQTRMRIDRNGDRYPVSSAAFGNQNAVEELKKELSPMIAETGTVRYGPILETIGANAVYYIAGYKGHKILWICDGENKVKEVEGIIKIEMVEKNQTYCWLVPYDQEVALIKLKEGKGVLLMI